MALALRRRVEDSGIIPESLRKAALAVGGGSDGELPEPYNALVQTIGEASYRVTDRLVDAVLEAAGSEKAAFEVIMSASIGAGLRRWDAASRVIEEAADAAS
jgi:hypothetical protein